MEEFCLREVGTGRQLSVEEFEHFIAHTPNVQEPALGYSKAMRTGGGHAGVDGDWEWLGSEGEWMPSGMARRGKQRDCWIRFLSY
ncbi:hypothetical protein ACP70R_048256 [Stipagrostis hirtigluma subsp. patula]